MFCTKCGLGQSMGCPMLWTEAEPSVANNMEPLTVGSLVLLSPQLYYMETHQGCATSTKERCDHINCIA